MVDYTIAFSPYLWYKNIQYLKVLKSTFFYRKMETHDCVIVNMGMRKDAHDLVLSMQRYQ